MIMTIRTLSQRLKPVPSFNFVNRREIEFALAAINLLAESGEVDPVELDDFNNFREAFQTFALQV